MSQSSPATHVFAHKRKTHAGLPPSQFGELVGPFDHFTLVAEGKTRPDNNHVYLWIRVPSGATLGVYECAFNIHSTDQSNVLFTTWEEDLTGKALPPPGFTPTPLSYAALGLKDADFKPIQQGDLQTLVTGYAQTCALMAAYGHTYSDGTGLHDIHLNSGEAPGSGHPNQTGQDGALVFYFTPAAPAPPVARWVFIRFDTQHLPV